MVSKMYWSGQHASECLACTGLIVYHGPVDSVLEFFEELGFQLPARKGVADFLQVWKALPVCGLSSQSAK